LADPARLSDHPCGSIGRCDPAARLFTDGFDELCEWLMDLLEKGFFVPLVAIGSQYKDILERRDETFTDSMLRTTNIRNRLNARFPEKLHFEKITNYEVRYTDATPLVLNMFHMECLD
jgi:hypothetical protein